MKAAVYYNNKKVKVEERPKPRIGPGEILMKVMASGICGSDIMEWYRIRKAPTVLGHEVAGEIIAVGENVTNFRAGDRIVATHHVPCGSCHYCKHGQGTVCHTLRTTSFDPGGFSQFVRLPAINVEKGTMLLPDSVSFEEATFVEPLGCVIRGQRHANMQPGYSVLVLGSGISGLLHIKLARVLGARKIFATDIKEFRLKAAKNSGADIAFDAITYTANDLEKANEGRLADLVIVCTGAPNAIGQALKSVDKGGTILLFAPTPPQTKTQIDLNELWSKGVNIITSYAAIEKDLTQALHHIETKRVKVKDLITHTIPLKDIQKGFNLTASGKDSIKVIIEPQK